MNLTSLPKNLIDLVHAYCLDRACHHCGEIFDKPVVTMADHICGTCSAVDLFTKPDPFGELFCVGLWCDACQNPQARTYCVCERVRNLVEVIARR